MRNCSPLQFLGANNGNRTHLYTLGRYHSTDELYSHRGEEALLKFEDFKRFTNHPWKSNTNITFAKNNGKCEDWTRTSIHKKLYALRKMVYQTSPDIVMFSYITTDCFNACLLDIILHKTSSRQLKEINNSKTPKPQFLFWSQMELTTKLKFKVKFLKLSFLLNLQIASLWSDREQSWSLQ